MADSIYRGFIRGCKGNTQDHQASFLKQCAIEQSMKFKAYKDMYNLLSELQDGDLFGVIDVFRISPDPEVVLKAICDINKHRASLHIGGEKVHFQTLYKVMYNLYLKKQREANRKKKILNESESQGVDETHSGC